MIRRAARRGIVASLLLLLLGTALDDVAAPAAAAAPVNDAKYRDQWGLQRVGAQYAWSRSTGKGVMIAVVDTGVDLSHPDLARQLVPGRDFVSGDDDPRDETGHGTLVAGIAAAASNNRKGIASVAPGAQILPVRVLAGNGTGRPADTAAGIRWAVDTARARWQRLVVNLSLDWEPARSNTDLIRDVAPANFVRDPAIDAAVKEAAGAGAVVVVAAGNEGKDQTPYDATTPGVLVVGASDRSDRRASFSNHGKGLDLLAPGIDILTTYWTPRTGSTYGIAKGTSVSVPFVSGTAALLMASGLSNVEAVAAILDTARNLGPPGWDPETGGGLLDAAAALGTPRTGSGGLPAAPHASPAPPKAPAAPHASPGAPVAPAALPAPTPPAGTQPAPVQASPTPAPFTPPAPLAAKLGSQNGPQVPGSAPEGAQLAVIAMSVLAALATVPASRRATRTSRAPRDRRSAAVRSEPHPSRRAHGPARRSRRAPPP